MQLLQHCLLHTITETLSMSQLLRLGSFDHASMSSMSTCVAQSAKCRTSDLSSRYNWFESTGRHKT